MRTALLHAGVSRRQPLYDTRLRADRGDGLANVVVQFARHIAAHALFGFQQPLRQAMITRQLILQRLVQFAQTLNACPEQQPGEALRQQRKQ